MHAQSRAYHADVSKLTMAHWLQLDMDGRASMMSRYDESLACACRSLSTDGLDASKFGLSQSKSSAEEWARRGANLLENEHYSKAADAFRNAGDVVWATMAAAYARLNAVGSLASEPERKREAFLVRAVTRC